MHELDTNQSITATVCEQAALFGATPEQGRLRFQGSVGPGGRYLRYHGSLRHHCRGMWRRTARSSPMSGRACSGGFVNMLDVQTQRLDREADRLVPEMRDLQREQDGSEIRSRELELVTDRAENLSERRDAFERMRDTAAEAYRVETGEVWRPQARVTHFSGPDTSRHP